MVMGREEILHLIRSLAQSQGSYGRLLRDLENLRENRPDDYEAQMQIWEDENFHDPVEFILYVEG